MRLRLIHRYRLSYSCRNPEVDAQVTMVPPRRATKTLAPKVSRPGCSKTMSVPLAGFWAAGEDARGANRAADVRLLGAGHHTGGGAAGGQRHLGGVGAESA